MESEQKELIKENEEINLEAEKLNELISWDEFKGDFT
jgi:regulator of replication initiation timing